ncbi:hypothetical protein [Paenibacillus sp. WLX2291]|uniref:hypothetical protein n=1 Tax=Paenibacillus sp. WLX2291 TaxID=3296934 RepID=UPI003983E443
MVVNHQGQTNCNDNVDNIDTMKKGQVIEMDQVVNEYMLPKGVQEQFASKWSNSKDVEDLLPLLNQILSLLDDAYLASEGSLQTEIFQMWQKLQAVVEEHKQ